METEDCFNVLIEPQGEPEASSSSYPLSPTHQQTLEWLLAETFDPKGLQLEQPFLSTTASTTSPHSWLVEFGPRLTFTSAFSSNAISICQACACPESLQRLEKSQRYLFGLSDPLSSPAQAVIRDGLHDRMTQQEYTTPLQFDAMDPVPEPVRTIPILEQGQAALEQLNQEMGLGFDDFDLEYYTKLFQVNQSIYTTTRCMESGCLD